MSTSFPDLLAPVRSPVLEKSAVTPAANPFDATFTRPWVTFFQLFTQWANLQGTTEIHAFDAADYGAFGGGSWTVDSLSGQYYTSRLVGDTLFVSLSVVAKPGGTVHSTVAGTVNYLTVQLPLATNGQGYEVVDANTFVGWLNDNDASGVVVPVKVFPVVGADYFVIQKPDFSNLTASAANGTGVNVNFWCQVALV